VRRRPPTAGRRDPIPSQAATWTPAQAQHWLGTLGQGLGRYGPLFVEHEVAGATLLELGAGDLDYMGIRPLAHRKALLRGVQELREAVQAGVEATASAGAAGSGSGAAGSEPQQPQLVHWSHLQPLPEPKAAMAAQASAAHGDGGGDLRFGAHDEAAEAEAFKAAVMAWRNAGKTSSGVVAGNSVAAPAAGAGSSPAAAGTGAGAANTSADGAVGDSSAAAGMWLNPFFGGAPEQATAAGGGLSATDRAGATGARTSAAAASTAAAASSLSAGEYDEEAERRAFQQAVMEWRTGRKASSDGAPAAGATAGSGAGTTPPERAPCYQCFRMCPLSSAYVPAAEEAAAASLAGKVFCSAACFEAVRAARAALRATVRDAERQVAQLDGSSSSSSGQPAAAAAGDDAPGGGAAGSRAHAARVQQLQRELEAMSRDPTPIAEESATSPSESVGAAAAAAHASRSAARPLGDRGSDGAGSNEAARGPEALAVASQEALHSAGVATDASFHEAQPRADAATASSSRQFGEASSAAAVPSQERAAAPAASLTGPDGGKVAPSDVDLSAVLSAAEETASLAAAELLQRRKRALEPGSLVPAAGGAPAAATAAAATFAPAAQLPTDMQGLQGFDMEAFL
jgi:hypothetical protein